MAFIAFHSLEIIRALLKCAGDAVVRSIGHGLAFNVS